jgi:hypothetical protein
VEAARLIREGAISSEELVEACLARIREVDPEVQAWAFLDPGHALGQARAADAWRLEGRPVGPLHGVPVGVKDIIDTADMPTESGSVLHAGRQPGRDATVVAMLRAAGAVIMGKTVTTEFATYAPGKTRNPHNPAHTPGGSSSGSAAAVAAGMVPLAARQPDQRVRHPAGRVLRRVRLQADPWPDPAPRRLPALEDARPRGPVRPHQRRHRAAGRAARRVRRARPGHATPGAHPVPRDRRPRSRRWPRRSRSSRRRAGTA